jgi:LPS-assembly protein
LWFGGCWAAGGHAQASEEEGIQLQSSPLLQDQPGTAAKESLPTFLKGDRTFGRPDLETVVEGNAELRRGDMVIRADRWSITSPTTWRARAAMSTSTGWQRVSGPAAGAQGRDV